MTDPRIKTRRLSCACCGENAGEWLQFSNQDTGYGLCARCADWIIERDQRKPPEWRTDMNWTYGAPGIHREAGPRFEA
jgi:hypothetical protein